MGNSYLGEATGFLITTVFDLYILVVMLRFLFQLVRVDFYNPVSQFVVKLTTPPLRVLRRFIPGYGGIDLASIVLMLGLKLVERWLVLGIQGVAAGPSALGVLAVAELLDLLLDIFVVSVLAQVILSWVGPPSASNPLIGLLRDLNEPVMRPARRLLPPVSGWDLSPILVLIALQVLSILVVSPIRDLGLGLL
jgi:YggT family protein